MEGLRDTMPVVMVTQSQQGPEDTAARGKRSPGRETASAVWVAGTRVGQLGPIGVAGTRMALLGPSWVSETRVGQLGPAGVAGTQVELLGAVWMVGT